MGMVADAHITDIVGARTARESREGREDIYVDQIPPSSVSTCSQRQVSPMQLRRAVSFSLTKLIDILKMQMVTNAVERKSKQEQMEMGREERIEERKEAKEYLQFERKEKAVDRTALS